jgi:hypothetical protein
MEKLGALKIFVVVMLSVLVLGTAEAQDRRNFWLLNNTRMTITRVYVSPHESGVWGNDVLGQLPGVPHGIGTLISFDSAGPTSCYFDFRLVFEDGTTNIYRQGHNLCTTRAVQFNQGNLTAF